MISVGWTAAQRTSRNYPCPVCGSPDWCGFSPDGRFVFCQRWETWDGRDPIRRTAAGAMFAVVDGQQSERQRGRHSGQEDGRRPPLSRQLLDRIYRDLANVAGLREEARYDIVTKREVSESLIARFGLDVIEQVPGFTFRCKACDGGGAIGAEPCPACQGLGKQRPRFRSVRNGRHDYGLIGCDESGLRFWGYSRRLPFNPITDDAKYMLFSSSRGGEPSIAGLPKYHVAGRSYPVDEVVITEGLIKAEIAAWKLRQRVIGIYSTAVDRATLAAVVQVIGQWRRCAF